MQNYVQNYHPTNSGDTLVEHVLGQMETCCQGIKANNPNAQCYPYYGTNLILRYNNAIKTCDASCVYQDCSKVVVGPGSGGSGGGTGQVVVP